MKTRSNRRANGRLIAATLALILMALGAITLFQPKLVASSPYVRCVSPAAMRGDLNTNPSKKMVAQMMVSAAENSSLRWEEQVGYLEYNVEGSTKWNRGYTGGIIGFTSRTSDMLELVRRYDAAEPDNPLTPFLPALEKVNGTSSKSGLGAAFEQAWTSAANDPAFIDAQDELAREWYLTPALEQANEDGLRSLGQFAYYDAMVQHGSSGFATIHRAAAKDATPPSKGGQEEEWLDAFFTAREEYMSQEVSDVTMTRVTTAQRGLLRAGELDLRAPLAWDVYGDHFRIEVAPFCGLF